MLPLPLSSDPVSGRITSSVPLSAGLFSSKMSDNDDADFMNDDDDEYDLVSTLVPLATLPTDLWLSGILVDQQF